ncbi:MAG: hypothetical protein EBQ99_03865 [Planctomycetes bacterium]|nr:hypothetical protein [Planctomycetota bacterium]
MPFETIRSEAGVLWRRSSLLHGAGIPHAFSTRIGGVSPAPFDSLNLGLADAPGQADAWVHVQANWTRLLHACGLADRDLIRARQVHGTVVLHADREPGVARSEPPFAEADALVTAHAGHAISVRVADCAPVLLADPVAGVVAAVHAGWRGVVGGIVPAAVGDLLQRSAHPERMEPPRQAWGPGAPWAVPAWPAAWADRPDRCRGTPPVPPRSVGPDAADTRCSRSRSWWTAWCRPRCPASAGRPRPASARRCAPAASPSPSPR